MYRIKTNSKKFAVVCYSNRELAAWILYRMKLANITQVTIAAKAAVTPTMIRSVIYSRKTSARIRGAIAQALGYPTWKELTSHCHTEVAA